MREAKMLTRPPANPIMWGTEGEHMDAKIDLLECPFCGAAPRIEKQAALLPGDTNIRLCWRVSCAECGRARTEEFPTAYEVTDSEALAKIPSGTPSRVRDGLKSAAEEWNARAAKPEAPPALDPGSSKLDFGAG